MSETSDLQSQIRDDFLTFHGLEAVTYVAADSGSTTAISYALRREVDGAERPQLGYTTPNDSTVWHFLVQDLAFDPQISDRIVDGSGDTWNVVSFKLQSLSQRWRCVCVRNTMR